MKGLENNAAELFRLMDRVRKAWQSVTPVRTSEQISVWHTYGHCPPRQNARAELHAVSGTWRSYADRACGRHASKPARIEPARQRAGGTGLCGARARPG